MIEGRRVTTAPSRAVYRWDEAVELFRRVQGALLADAVEFAPALLTEAIWVGLEAVHAFEMHESLEPRSRRGFQPPAAVARGL